MRKRKYLPQYKGAMPPYDPQEKTKRKSKNMDSHLLVTPAIFKPGSMVLKAFGFLIRDFRHDKKKGVIPEWFYEGSKLFKGKCICIGENIRKHSLLHFKKQATLY